MMRFLTLFSLLMLAACASSEPDYYTLASIASEQAPPTGAPISVKVLRPGLPPSLDRPDMVQMAGSYRVMRDSADQWAEGLDTLIARTLAADLSFRLPAGSSVTTERGGISVDPAYLVEVEIQSFGMIDGKVEIGGQLVVKDRARSSAVPGPFQFAAEVRGGSAEAFAAASSRLVAKLADTASSVILSEAKDLRAAGAPQ